MDPQACGTRPEELDTIHQGIHYDGEVGTLPRRLQIGIIRRDPPPVAHIHRPGRDAGALWGIMIVDPALPEIECCVPEGTMEGLPRRKGRSIDGNGTPTAVVRMIAIVKIVFQAAEGGQHLRERPAPTAALRPEIEIFGNAPDGRQGIDRRTPAHPPALLRGNTYARRKTVSGS
jgi:hypothetical protein